MIRRRQQSIGFTGWILGVLGWVGSSVAAPPPENDGMRCGQRIVAPGDSKPVVHEKCGAPQYEDQRTVTIGPGRYVVVEEWYYSASRGSFARLLTFRDGRLWSIRALPR